ncbi:MAG: DUF2892 domain-containing protein [Dehalobacterium sp.]
MQNKMYFKKNIGPVDRVARIAIGSALVLSPVILGRSSIKQAILHGVGGSTILEGIIGY